MLRSAIEKGQALVLVHVAAVILVAKERLLSTVSPLRDVVKETKDDDTCQSTHEGRLSAARSPVKN